MTESGTMPDDHASERAYEREEIDGITVVRLLRPVSAERLLAVIREVAAEGVTARRLWNIGPYLDYSSDVMRGIARLGRQLWPEPARVAYVASRELGFGLLRMFEAYREQEGYETHVFYDEKEALDWLRLA